MSQSNALNFHRLGSATPPLQSYWSALIASQGTTLVWHFLAPCRACPHYTATLWSECCRLHPCPDGVKEAQAGTTGQTSGLQSPLYQGHNSASRAPRTPAGIWVPWAEERGVRRQESGGHRKGHNLGPQRPEDEGMKLRISFRGRWKVERSAWGRLRPVPGNGRDRREQSSVLGFELACMKPGLWAVAPAPAPPAAKSSSLPSCLPLSLSSTVLHWFDIWNILPLVYNGPTPPNNSMSSLKYRQLRGFWLRNKTLSDWTRNSVSKLLVPTNHSSFKPATDVYN